MLISHNRNPAKLLGELEKNSLAWLEFSPVCTKVVDLEFNLQYMSTAGVEAMCIDDITAYYNKPYPLQIYPQPHRDNWEACFQRVKTTGEITKQDVVAVSMDGREIWFDSTFVPVLDRNGTTVYIIIVSIDITERKSAEKNLLKLNAELEVRVAKRTLELEVANAQLKAANAKLTVLSETDALTKIPNRRVYDRKMTESIQFAKRTGKPLSLLILDIDHFKIYNDTYGHDIGDITLQKVAESIQTSLLRQTDLVARFGGEEFVIVLPETDSQSALKVAETIRCNIESLGIMFHGSVVSDNLTASLGVASLEGESLSETELLKRADAALYTAKSAGRNRCQLYTP